MISKLGIYADLKQLFLGEEADTVQQALIQSVKNYNERGIYPINSDSSLIFFPTVREYDFFIEDMRKQGCRVNKRFIPISLAEEVILKNPIKVEKTVSDEKNRLFIAMTVSYSLYNAKIINQVDVPDVVFKAVEQSIEQVLMTGISGAGDFNLVIRGLNIHITALEFKGAEFIKKTTSNKFFAPIDWMFDGIDRIFASGSGTDFSLMGGTLLNEHLILIQRAVKESLFTALDDNYTIESSEMRIKVRILIEKRGQFLDELGKIEHITVFDDHHDGTYWTFDIGLKTQTFYNNRSFARLLDYTNAEIVNQHTP